MGCRAVFLLVNAVMKLAKPAFVVDGTVKLGYSENVIVPLGIVLLACTILYLIPRTAVLGAILLTGYLGGTVDVHVRAGEGLFPILFPVVFGTLLWGGLWLRNPRLHTAGPLPKLHFLSHAAPSKNRSRDSTARWYACHHGMLTKEKHVGRVDLARPQATNQ